EIESVALSNRIAPEHLVIMSDNAEDICEDVRHAGAIFLGHFTPVAVGDYIAGPSHTLPTGGTARFSSGLTANHFMKSSSVVRYDRDSLVEDAPKLTRIAEAEQLNAHAGSVLARLEEED
ncbi:MAG: histidinol dehydrogenase, partial [Planctomycetes bacterium]|nr:histidinol dehydrogenase [Planctomycetota bacterium]